MVYMISYDLNKQDKDYEGVFQAIKDASDGTWIKPLLSTWLIRSNYSNANAVYKVIKPYLDNNDNIYICELKHNNQGWLSEKTWSFIREQIFK